MPIQSLRLHGTFISPKNTLGLSYSKNWTTPRVPSASQMSPMTIRYWHPLWLIQNLFQKLFPVGFLPASLASPWDVHQSHAFFLGHPNPRAFIAINSIILLINFSNFSSWASRTTQGPFKIIENYSFSTSCNIGYYNVHLGQAIWSRLITHHV